VDGAGNSESFLAHGVGSSCFEYDDTGLELLLAKEKAHSLYHWAMGPENDTAWMQRDTPHISRTAIAIARAIVLGLFLFVLCCSWGLQKYSLLIRVVHVEGWRRDQAARLEGIVAVSIVAAGVVWGVEGTEGNGEDIDSLRRRHLGIAWFR
jgi:hypothetical protein